MFSRTQLQMALQASVAAALAWLAVQPMAGVADEYPYYAPLGAVATITGTVVGSLRATVGAFLAIALGAVPAVLAIELDLRALVGLPLVVGIGTVLSGWRVLGSMASWVPVSGLFILIIGSGDPRDYVTAYLGLIALGGLIALVVNALWPLLPLRASHTVQETLRGELAEQLENLAEGLDSDPLPSTEEWHRRRHDIEEHARRMHEMLEEVQEAEQANWRATRWRKATDRVRQRARSLNQLSFLIQEAYDLVVRYEAAEHDEVALGPELRPAAVKALRRTAEALAGPGDGATTDEDALAAAREATDEYAEKVRHQQFTDEGEYFAAGSLVTTLRRTLVTITPTEDAQPRY